MPAISSGPGVPVRGFVRSIEQTLPGRDATVPMTYWNQDDLPFYYGLARAFPVVGVMAAKAGQTGA